MIIFLISGISESGSQTDAPRDLGYVKFNVHQWFRSQSWWEAYGLVVFRTKCPGTFRKLCRTTWTSRLRTFSNLCPSLVTKQKQTNDTNIGMQPWIRLLVSRPCSWILETILLRSCPRKVPHPTYVSPAWLDGGSTFFTEELRYLVSCSLMGGNSWLKYSWSRRVQSHSFHKPDGKS